MEHTLMLDIAVCIIAAWVLAVLFQTAKQPLLLAYLLAGFAIGPHGFRWVTDAESIETIASIGLVLLLFMIGLEIDLKRMISMGKVIITTSAVQILSGLAAGWLFFKLTGLADEWLEALYLGMAVALSSTVILVKILHQKRELDTLAGRITLGVLVLQDLAAIVFLAVQPNLKSLAAGSILLALGKWACWYSFAWRSAVICSRPFSRRLRWCPNWCWLAHWRGALRSPGSRTTSNYLARWAPSLRAWRFPPIPTRSM